MAKTKTEKIAGIEEQIAQLENQKRLLKQQQKEQDRKARTNRFCKRMGHLEGLLPDMALITEEQFHTLLDKTIITEQSRRTLKEFIAENAAKAAAEAAKTAAQGNATPIPKTTATPQQSHEDVGADEDDAARATG